MTDQEKIAFKVRLKALCRQIIEQRVEALRFHINQAQATANSEEKSSAGDKYETSRAMSHLEKDMHARQLGEVVKELASLQQVEVNRICTAGEPGGVLDCGNISFFVAAGLGKQMIDERTIFFLSPNAPLARTLINKQAGDHFTFNGNQITILEIY